MLPFPRSRTATRRSGGRTADETPSLGSLLTGVSIFILAASGALYVIAQAAH